MTCHQITTVAWTSLFAWMAFNTWEQNRFNNRMKTIAKEFRDDLKKLAPKRV